MKVFVTGASGFVGSAVVQELLHAGHSVTGMVRRPEAMAALEQIGAAAVIGNLDDPESIVSAVADSDVVIHTAFNHDFSRFKENCATDRKVIEALGKALAGTGRPLIMTSGIGLIRSESMITEDMKATLSESIPRAASEEAAMALNAAGVPVYIVRLPPTVHGRGDHGFVPMLIALAREKGISAYIGTGGNLWPAVHRLDAARLYRLIAEQQPEQRVFHAVAETGIPFRAIAEEISAGLGVPDRSITGEEVAAHFGWFAHFAAMDCKADAAQTMRATGWSFSQPGLLQDMQEAYF
ncbi:SDR family oxidoreductase [Rurimicrobium arvi]|uniref:SDR family oxidoreductase n=1 Tax=Rurimicrobium arvi TaxID=2049916 RepID=A0ABP8MY01_9BACT